MKIFKYFTLCLFISVSANAQNVNMVVERYKEAIADIEVLHCQVEQLDTFVTGNVWNYVGQLDMLRKQDDPLFGFQFKASKEVGGEALYDGLSDFQINHEKKEYELNANPQSYIVGSPGGQLVVPEMMVYQDPDVTPTLSEDGKYYVLRYAYPDIEEYDITKREKRIILNKSTFLPIQVIERQESLGKKQVMTRKILDMEVNEIDGKEAFQKDFLNNYKMLVEESRKDLHADLLNTKVKAFQLETFAGAQISTQPKDAKLLLIDFWEVWCGPCVQSMPKVQALADKYRGEGLEVVGVLMDPNSQDSAEKLIAKKGVAFTQALGGKELREYFRVHAIPQYVLIDQKGIIQQVYRGYDDKMENQIKKLLAEAK